MCVCFFLLLSLGLGAFCIGSTYGSSPWFVHSVSSEKTFIFLPAHRQPWHIEHVLCQRPTLLIPLKKEEFQDAWFKGFSGDLSNSLCSNCRSCDRRNCGFSFCRPTERKKERRKKDEKKHKGRSKKHPAPTLLFLFLSFFLFRPS